MNRSRQTRIDLTENTPQAVEAPNPLEAVLAGRWVKLVCVSPEHIDFLYELSMEEPNNARWRFHGTVISKEEFVSNLWPGVLSQFLVVTRKSQRPIGLVVAYQADLHAGYVYLGGIMTSRAQTSGLSPEAFKVFMRYLSSNWRVRKFYFEFPVFNENQFSSIFGGEMLEEARLRDHLFYNGTYWDMRILSISPPHVP